MFKKFFQATLAVVTLSSALPASAAVILSSDFTGTSGDASNVTWTENDVSVTNTLDPQDSSLNSLDLFSTYSDVFAVDHNLHDDGDWFVDIFVSLGCLSTRQPSIISLLFMKKGVAFSESHQTL